MATENLNDQDFDPQAEFYDEEGYRYRSFAAWLAQDKDHCGLNTRIDELKTIREWSKNACAWFSIHWQEREKAHPSEYLETRSGHAFASAYRDFAISGRKHPRDCGRTTRTGVARAVAAPSHAVHPADEPEVPRRVGP